MKEKAKSVYTKAEVEAVVSKLKADFGAKSEEQRDRIFALVEENRELSAENAELKRRDKLISDALVAAAEKAKEIEDAARRRYDGEIKRLRVFQSKWESYFDAVSRRYPVDDNLEKVQAFVERVGGILGGERPAEPQEKVAKVEKAFSGVRKETAVCAAEPFDPKARIDAYVAGETPFDMEEVLRPKEDLDLEKLCRELGLMD